MDDDQQRVKDEGMVWCRTHNDSEMVVRCKSPGMGSDLHVRGIDKECGFGSVASAVTQDQ